MRIDSSNSVAVLTFADEGDYPRLTQSVMIELADLLRSVEHESAFRGVVIAANSQSFATGAEVEEVTTLEGIAAREFARRGQTLFNRIASFPIPVVAAIRGYCLGGGFDLAPACHQRVATYDSSFGHPGASLGLITGWGGTQRLPRLLGKSAALQILLTGERIPATQALTLGLVDELGSTQDLVERAARRAERAAISERTNAAFL
jgi:enoyl-CoA hydratase